MATVSVERVSRKAGRLLVTGASGFVGRHVRMAVESGLFGEAQFHGAQEGLDVRDAQSLRALIDRVAPESVLHLAAQSFVPQSFADPRETFEINLIGTLNLLQALDQTGFSGRMIYVSSGDVYGLVPESELPVDEERMPEPRNPYAASKVAAEQLCLQWRRTTGMDIVIARPFNHVGPGQNDRFVLPALARQIVAIEKAGRYPIVEAGDLDTTRDFTDVRDIVAAYAAMFAAGSAGATYVVGSGTERRVRDILLAMCEIAGIDPEVRQDPAKLRPVEQRRMVADPARLYADTGWRPRIAFETTLNDILTYARNHP
jgi:GDP-4-dehydro-6-deoxy-D-mannose reductase